MNNKAFIYITFVLSMFPLLAYPGVLMAGLMALAAPIPEGASLMLLEIARIAIWSSLAYPVAMLVCWYNGLTARGGLMALGYMLFCVAAFGLWFLAESGK